MKPYRIVATVDGQIMSPDVHLDGLLAAVIAKKLDMPPIGVCREEQAQENCALLREHVAKVLKWNSGGFYEVSDPQFAVEAYERRHLNRRFPTVQGATYGHSKVARVQIGTGLSKNYRIPTQAVFLNADKIEWFATAELDGLRALLDEATHLGKKTSLGLGKVANWQILDEMEPWDGFPIMRDGVPLRALPQDHPGLRDYRADMRAICFPYWSMTNERPCACPL